MANPARAYLATQVKTTSQGELLVMLYEAAIKFLKRAKMEIENKDYAKKGVYISKAMAIIHELIESLNKEKGGNITPTLLSLYQFCTAQLIQANIRLDTKRIDDVIRILDGIRSAYAQIVSQNNGTTASTERAAKARLQAQAEVQAATLPTAPHAASGQAEEPAAPATPPRPKGNAANPSKTMRYGMSGLAGMAGVAGLAGMTRRAAANAAKPARTPEPAAPRPAPEPEASVAPPTTADSVPAAPPLEAAQAAEPKRPVPPQPERPKLRNTMRAAKFRAANAYSHNS